MVVVMMMTIMMAMMMIDCPFVNSPPTQLLKNINGSNHDDYDEGDYYDYDYNHDYDYEYFSALMMATMMTIHLPLPPLPLCHGGFAFYSRCQSETNTP